MKPRRPRDGSLVYFAAVFAAVVGAAWAVLAPEATMGTVSPVVIAVSLGGLVLGGPSLIVREMTPLTLAAWSAAGVALLGLTGVAMALLGIDVSISNVGLAYLFWMSPTAVAYLAFAGATGRDGSTVDVAIVPWTSNRLGRWLAYLATSVLPAGIVVVLFLGAQAKEGPTLSVWVLPAAGGVASEFTVRPGTTFDLIGAVDTEQAGQRPMELVVELAGEEAINRSFLASDTPVSFTTAVSIPPDAPALLSVRATARFAGTPGSEVTAVLRLVVSTRAETPGRGSRPALAR